MKAGSGVGWLALAVLGCMGCSGGVEGIGSAERRAAGDDEGGTTTGPQNEAGAPGEASAGDSGGYCFGPGAVCDPAKGAEPGVACCNGSCSATTGTCAVPSDGGAADAGHTDAAPVSEDAGFWIADASSPDCDAATCSINGRECINDQAAGCQPDQTAWQEGVCGQAVAGFMAFDCSNLSLLPSMTWNTCRVPNGSVSEGVDGSITRYGSIACCPQGTPTDLTLCSALDCYELGTCR